MITYLTGELLVAQPTSIVVGVNGIGYELIIPLSSFDRLPRKGERVTVLTHLHLKEDGVVLYGFMTEDERSLFRMLIAVTGIGPKIAMGILSGISPDNFRLAVREGSARMLAAVPGIGRKKAERLIVELKDKLGALETGVGGGELPTGAHAHRDAMSALVSLGYTQLEAQKAVAAAAAVIGKTADVESLVREALKTT